MVKVKAGYVKYEAVPRTGVVNYSVEKRMIDWKDFDKVLNVGNWFKINYDRKLVLAKYPQFKVALLFSYILILIIGICVGWLI